MKEIEIGFQTNDGKVFETLSEAIYHETGKKIGEILYYYFYDSGAWEYQDDNGFHLFSPDETELTKDAKGEIVYCNLYNAGAWEYIDDNGLHLFAPDGTELTKDAKGKVVYCHFHNNGVWEYIDENEVHKGQWKDKKRFFNFLK